MNLREPSQHVGGLSAGALSHCDSNQMRRETLIGLFDEWHRRVFATVARGILDFERQKSEGSFRSWLATIHQEKMP